MARISSALPSIGIIGAGAMGSALARGLVHSGAAPGSISISDIHNERVGLIARELGILNAESNEALCESSSVVILAVKPFTVNHVLAEIGASLRNVQLLISIAAGVRIEAILEQLDFEVPIVRAMPNNAAQVRQGACALCAHPKVSRELFETACQIFRSCGTAVEVEEEMLDAVTGLSGTGPAYVYMMIEALIDGGVKAGLPRVIAHDLAAQTVLGAAKMVIETGKHPAELRDLVATPSGTTITAVALLEKAGFRAALIDAVGAATQRSKELGS